MSDATAAAGSGAELANVLRQVTQLSNTISQNPGSPAQNQTLQAARAELMALSQDLSDSLPPEMGAQLDMSPLLRMSNAKSKLLALKSFGDMPAAESTIARAEISADDLESLPDLVLNDELRPELEVETQMGDAVSVDLESLSTWNLDPEPESQLEPEPESELELELELEPEPEPEPEPIPSQRLEQKAEHQSANSGIGPVSSEPDGTRYALIDTTTTVPRIETRHSNAGTVPPTLRDPPPLPDATVRRIIRSRSTRQLKQWPQQEQIQQQPLQQDLQQHALLQLLLQQQEAIQQLQATTQELLHQATRTQAANVQVVLSAPSELGISFNCVPDTRSGLVRDLEVAQVDVGSQADHAVRQGWRVLAIGGTAVNLLSASEVLSALQVRPLSLSFEVSPSPTVKAPPEAVPPMQTKMVHARSLGRK